MKANKTAAFKTLDTFASSRVALIQGMKDAGYKTVEDARAVVIEWACSKTGCEYRTAESSGAVKLVSSDKAYEKTKTVVRDVMLMLQGTTRHASSARKEVDNVESALKLWVKMTAAEQRAFLKAVSK
jgi:hypothetical protein